MTRAHTYFASFFFAVALCLSAPAHGQLRRVLDLNRQAMDAYTNLEVEQAMDLLQQALQNAQSRGVTGVPLANTYANLGIVAVGGFGDNASGLQHFMNALREDSSVQLDPLNSTPDIQSVFLLARNRVGGNGGNTNTRPPPPRSAGPGEIPHTPVTEQTANTAIPIFVEVPDSAPVSGITVHYQAPGMRIFRAVEMRRMSGGFGLELPCSEVFAPRVSYYLEAFDDDGDRIGVAGSPESPFAVEVVSSLSGPPPALPGQSPPMVCGESECPPGMDCGGGGGNAGLGETCITSAECRGGLTCEDNFCVSGSSSDDDDDDEPIDDGDMPRFFIDAGLTVGFGYASSGSRADTNDEVRDGNNLPTTPSFIGPGVGDCPDEGFDCVRLEQPGFLPTLALRVTTGYWIIPRFALAATLRFQFNAGEGSLSNLLLGLRGMYQLTAPSGDGLNANVFLGTSIGQIQLQPGQNGEAEPFMISGLNGIQIGSNIGYRFTRNIGVTVTPEVHLFFPQFLFNFDLTASLSASF